MAQATYAGGRDEIQRARWASIGNVIAGAWLIIAPFLLNFEGANNAQWNHIIVGAAVIVLAAIRAADPDERQGLSWVNVALGVWMIVAPFILNYTAIDQARNNSIILGVIIAALGAFSAYETNQGHREERGASRSM